MRETGSAFSGRLRSAQVRISQAAGFGAAGGVLGFGISEILIDHDRFFTTPSEIRIHTGFWFALVLLGIGGAIIAGMAFQNRSLPAAEVFVIGLVATLVGGFVAGYIAQFVYETMLNSTEESSVRIPRAIGWSIAGGLGGLAVGVSFKSAKRIQNGLMGGAVGGLIGGLLFDSFGSDASARLVAISLVGFLMGGLIGLVEAARTALWLRVVSGELRGREFPVLDNVTSVGRSRSNQICLPGDSSVLEKHLEIHQDQGGTSFVASLTPVLLNGQTCQSGQLKHGDLLLLGRTQVVIDFREGTPPPAMGPSDLLQSAILPLPPSRVQGQSPVEQVRKPPVPTAARPVIPVQRKP